MCFYVALFCLHKICRSKEDSINKRFSNTVLNYVTDIDECRDQPNICGNGTCENLPGSHKCVCYPGFQLTSVGDCFGENLLFFNILHFVIKYSC